MNYLILFFVMSISGLLYGQNGNGWCATDQILEHQLESIPNGKALLHESRVLSATSNNNNSSSSKMAAITVPVVVHVIHDNGIGNISDAQILSALDILNIDYRRENADTSDTRNTFDAPFQHHADGMDIEFKLAKIDPQGNCTNGIVRVNAPELSNNANDDCKYTANGGSDAWPVDRYFNIWVVNSISTAGFGASGIIAGYAYYPNFGPADYYGILIDDDYFGNIGTANWGDGRVLTHEMGHALGLPHIFEGGCQTGDCYQEGDYSCDTPPQEEANWSCNPAWNSCTNIPVNDPYGADVMDQIENYMSYNSCQNMFSHDQVTIMENNFANVSFLANMISPQNVLATGVNNPTVFCAADFDCFKRVLCRGSVVDFHDYSHTAPTNWTWNITPGQEGVDFNFVGGTSMNSQFPSIEFVTSGYYDISLTSGDGVTSDTELKQGFVQVLPHHGTLPFYDGFEAYTSLASTENWDVDDPDGNGTFEIVNGVAHLGNKSVKLGNYSQAGEYTDELISSQVDLSNIDPLESITLSFRYAYRKRLLANDEWLKVMISKDCAESWVQRKTMHGNMLSTLTSVGNWSPSSQQDWVTVHMTNITSSYYVENFRYKFVFDSDFGNNFYLDDINMYAGAPSDNIVTASIDEVSDVVDFSVFPNPVEDDLTVQFGLFESANSTVTVTDVTGKTIKSYTVQAAQGTNQVIIDTKELAIGSYFVQVEAGGVKRSAKFVVK